MASIRQEWRETYKHISEYKVTKLPAGTPESHEEFKVMQYQKRQGTYRMSEEDKLKEAAEELAKKEAKICNSDAE